MCQFLLPVSKRKTYQINITGCNYSNHTYKNMVFVFIFLLVKPLDMPINGTYL